SRVRRGRTRPPPPAVVEDVGEGRVVARADAADDERQGEDAGQDEEDGADPALAVADPDDHEVEMIMWVAWIRGRGGASARRLLRGVRARKLSNPHRTARCRRE